MKGVIEVFGPDGRQKPVREITGLSTKTHDEVMMSYGYTHTVKKAVTIPAGEYALITMEVPANIVHHAEFRIVSAYNSPLEVAIVPNYTGSLPTQSDEMPAWNQTGPVVNPDVMTKFNYRGVQATNPLDVTPNESNSVEYGFLRATSGGFFTSSSQDTQQSLSGRDYAEGIHCVWAHNTGSDDCEASYQYQWHEYNV